MCDDLLLVTSCSPVDG